MTDDELRTILDWERNPYRFDELTDEWKAWATRVLRSAKVPTSASHHMGTEDAVIYLCRVLHVFETLHNGGMAEDELRGKFASAAVVSGLSATRDAGFYFNRALQNAESRGLVLREERDWWEPGMRPGTGWVALCKLTLAGQRLAKEAEPIEPAEGEGADGVVESVQNAQPNEETWPSERQAPAGAIPKGRAPGGRPRKWKELYSMIQDADQDIPKPKDQVIANRYNKRFGNSINAGTRKKATAGIVRDVRNRYPKLNREEEHD